ncbi:amidoligase, partial [Klebsiella oxytoca]
SKEDILYKALRIDPARMRWCKKTNERLIEAINRKKPQTMEALKDIWYAGSTRGRDEHYNDTRYHGLNLHSTFT